MVSPGGKDGYIFHKDTAFGISGNLSFGGGLEGHARVGKGFNWDPGNANNESLSNNGFRDSYDPNNYSMGNFNL